MPSFIHSCILLFFYALIYSLTFKLVNYSYNVTVIIYWAPAVCLALLRSSDKEENKSDDGTVLATRRTVVNHLCSGLATLLQWDLGQVSWLSGASFSLTVTLGVTAVLPSKGGGWEVCALAPVEPFGDPDRSLVSVHWCADVCVTWSASHLRPVIVRICLVAIPRFPILSMRKWEGDGGSDKMNNCS